MKIPRIVKAMEYIDDDLVSGAVNTTTSKRNPAWAKWGAVAACLCLVIIGTIIWKHASPSNSTQNGITISENGVTIPQMDVSLSANASAEADMIGFLSIKGDAMYNMNGFMMRQISSVSIWELQQGLLMNGLQKKDM